MTDDDQEGRRSGKVIRKRRESPNVATNDSSRNLFDSKDVTHSSDFYTLTSSPDKQDRISQDISLYRDITNSRRIELSVSRPTASPCNHHSPQSPVADPEVDLFAGMKKKKKKTVALDLDDDNNASASQTQAQEEKAPTTSAAYAAPEPSSISAVSESQQVVEESSEKPAADDGGDMFADLKKKKKKKKEIPADLEGLGGEGTAPAASAGGDGLDVPIKKKKSKKQATDFAKEVRFLLDQTTRL